jgi:dihydrofolate reductase/predicted phosphodiesterase
VSRLLVFGDLHGDRGHFRHLVERAVEERCDALVSLGDFCYLPRDHEGRRFLRSSGALLRRAGLELLLVDGNHDDAESLARAGDRVHGTGPVSLGFRMHHLPAGTRFRFGRLRCLAYGGAFPVRSARAGRDWFRAVARERAALERAADGGEVDLLFCHDPRTLEQGAHARGSFAAFAAKLRPALVVYAHQHRPHASAAEGPRFSGSARSGTGRRRPSCWRARRRAGLSAAGAAGGRPGSRPERLRKESRMGKIVISDNVTLDGVVQDPAGDQGFRVGGWVGLIKDRPELAKLALDEALGAEALLVGRRSYEWLAARWPSRSGELADRLNSLPKYVVSSTLENPDWNNSTVLRGDAVGAVTKLKQELDGDIVVPASFQLVRTLMEHDLVDELRLKIFPVALGAGERLFGETSDKKPMRLVDTHIVEGDVVFLTYEVVREG